MSKIVQLAAKLMVDEMMKWIEDWEILFLASVNQMPENCTISFSGGIESSSIMFACAELDRLPKEAITFTVQGKETDDLPYAQKICNYFGVPLKIIDITETKESLNEKVRTIIKIIDIARNIDIQVCHIYSHLIPYMVHNNLVTGFYEDIHYEANAKVMIAWREAKNNQRSRESFDAFYKYGRRCIYNGLTKSGSIHNYITIEKYLNHYGINLVCPFKTKELFELSQKLTFEDTSTVDGKFKKKWFLIDVIFKKWFDKFGNQKNTNNMHTQGIKQMHMDMLLDGTDFKDTIAVYNRIYKDVHIPKTGKLI